MNIQSRKIIEVSAIEQPQYAAEWFDYLIHRLVTGGVVGVIEPKWEVGSEVDWVFTSRKTGEQGIVASCPVFLLRMILAQCGCRLEISPYGGHSIFEVRYRGEEQPTPHGFSLFLCNEQAMGLWMKLYLYRLR